MKIKRLFIAGAVGAAAVYFLDPNRGHDRRERVKGSFQGLLGQVDDAGSQARETVGAAADTTRSTADDARAAVEDAADAAASVVDEGRAAGASVQDTATSGSSTGTGSA